MPGGRPHAFLIYQLTFAWRQFADAIAGRPVARRKRWAGRNQLMIGKRSWPIRRSTSSIFAHLTIHTPRLRLRPRVRVKPYFAKNRWREMYPKRAGWWKR